MSSYNEYLHPRRLAIELLHSIRDIDCRISELKMLIDMNGLQQEKRKYILARIATLIDTRFKLVYSFMDVTKRDPELCDSSNPFDYLQIEYRHLRRQIYQYHPEIASKIGENNEVLDRDNAG